MRFIGLPRLPGTALGGSGRVSIHFWLATKPDIYKCSRLSGQYDWCCIGKLEGLLAAPRVVLLCAAAEEQRYRAAAEPRARHRARHSCAQLRTQISSACIELPWVQTKLPWVNIELPG